MVSTLRTASTEVTHREPTITFDGIGRTVTLGVVVFLNGSGDDIVIEAAPAAIPRGVWTLVWRLEVNTLGLTAEFANPGIILPPPDQLPARVTVLSSQAGVDGEWVVELRNEVVSANAFHYDISVDWSTIENQIRVNRKIKDPSIAVTPDPPPGG